MELGQLYQIKFENGTYIVCIFWGDRDNVQDAVEIIESNSEKFQAGDLVSLNVINNIPYKEVNVVKR